VKELQCAAVTSENIYSSHLKIQNLLPKFYWRIIWQPWVRSSYSVLYLDWLSQRHLAVVVCKSWVARRHTRHESVMPVRRSLKTHLSVISAMPPTAWNVKVFLFLF